MSKNGSPHSNEYFTFQMENVFILQKKDICV